VSAVPVIGFMVVALLAIAFAAVPLWRGANTRRGTLLVAAIALFVLAIGSGAYWMVGRPHLAQREARGLETNEVNALIPYLIGRVRQYPNDGRAWRYLGQAYMSARDPVNAAKALARAITVDGKGDPELNTAYGEALVMANRGVVPPEAESAFTAALAVDPSNAPARFYLGDARRAKGDTAGAAQMWQSLLADTPVTTPLYQMLVDRLALLTAQASGAGGAPDPRRMVEMLAARLKGDPNDALGWVRLMRAYAVLGETAKAKEALATARKTFAGNKDAQTAFSTAARALKLD
jgi:cytochrome c-type biogenesis protein CcmH